MKTANMDELKTMNFEDGVNYLESLGYLANDGASDVVGETLMYDTYYVSYNDEDEEEHQVSYVECFVYDADKMPLINSGERTAEDVLTVESKGWEEV